MEIYLDGKKIKEPASVTIPKRTNTRSLLEVDGRKAVKVWAYIGFSGRTEVCRCYTTRPTPALSGHAPSALR